MVNSARRKQGRLRFVVFGSSRQAVQVAALDELFATLRARDSLIFIDQPFAARLSSAGVSLAGTEVFTADAFAADFAISVGGDGTLLTTALRLHHKGIPIVGLNMGRLGYLADVMPSEIGAVVEALYAGRYSTERHSVLSVRIAGDKTGESFALNEVALLKRDTASMISISVTIDDEYMATYRADGLIVSTPTGSTAYNLSNGGPIMASSAQTFCLTAVAPHSLNLRPVVIDEKAVVRMRVESRSKSFLLAVDGRSTPLPQGAEVIVAKASYAIEMVKLPNKRYFETLRQKLMWAADVRE